VLTPIPQKRSLHTCPFIHIQHTFATRTKRKSHFQAVIHAFFEKFLFTAKISLYQWGNHYKKPYNRFLHHFPFIWIKNTLSKGSFKKGLKNAF
jgi:hypothetical protein